MRGARLVLIGIVTFAGCVSRPAFTLSDDSAIDRVVNSAHASELRRRIPAPLVYRIEDSDVTERVVYVGENHPTHTVRVGTYRVTADGQVWANTDQTLAEDRWVRVE